MNEEGTDQHRPSRKHLHSPESLPSAGDLSAAADLTRRHGQGNGLRVHRIYFAAVSFVGLLLIMGCMVIVAMGR